MPIISIAVLILFQRSILRPWKKLNSLQFLPSLAGWQCFLHTDYQSLNGKAALGRKISCLGLQQPVAITDDNRTGDTNQTGNVTISRSYVNIQNRILVWTNNSCTFLGKCRTLIRSKIHIDIYVTGGWGGGRGAVGGRQDLDVRSMFRIEFSIFQWSIRWLTLFWIRLCILKPRKKPDIISMKKFFIKNKVAKESKACKNVR